MSYHVVFVPTAKGILVGLNGRIVGTFETKDNAEECWYLTYHDDRAPDRSEYYNVEIVHG